MGMRRDWQVFIINLERRKDRLDYIKLEMERAEIPDYHVYSAFDNTMLGLLDQNGQTARLGRSFIGVYLSHLAVLKTALALNMNELMVFEDDIVVNNNFWNDVEALVKELPGDWDMLYLNHGSSNRNDMVSYKEQITPNLYRTAYVGCFAAYMLTGEGIVKLHGILNKLIEEHVDVTLSMHNYYNNTVKAYCVLPSIVEVNLD
jgi:GR25 family glycosyltransferase involved in LPS biosynthesis